MLSLHKVFLEGEFSSGHVNPGFYGRVAHGKNSRSHSQALCNNLCGFGESVSLGEQFGPGQMGCEIPVADAEPRWLAKFFHGLYAVEPVAADAPTSLAA